MKLTREQVDALRDWKESEDDQKTPSQIFSKAWMGVNNFSPDGKPMYHKDYEDTIDLVPQHVRDAALVFLVTVALESE